MINELNFKELYQVSLKATYPIEVGGKIIELGETVASFDKIQIANFQEIKSLTSANGGFGNRAQIIWETTKEIRINFTQGVFSKIQLALMFNTNLVTNQGTEKILIDTREEHESNAKGEIILNYTPNGNIFIYDKITGDKLTDWTEAGRLIYLNQQYTEVVVDYQYMYSNGFSVLQVGNPLTNGYLSLTGKMKVKDDTTGKVVTGIVKIPKLRLMSDLSIRVGSDAVPQVGRLDAVAVPEGVRGQQKVMEIIFLNDDIDADI